MFYWTRGHQTNRSQYDEFWDECCYGKGSMCYCEVGDHTFSVSFILDIPDAVEES